MARQKTIVSVPYSAHDDFAAWLHIVASRVKTSNPVTKAAHRRLQRATTIYLGHVRNTQDKKDVHRSALLDVAAEDSKLDLLVDDLANAFVGARIGKRSNPLAAFTSFAPKKLVRLAYSDEVDEVDSLLANIAAAAKKNTITLEGDAKTAFNACKKQLKITQASIEKLQRPADAESEARTSRDAAHASAHSSLQTLGAYLAGDHGANSDEFKRIFAPADPIVLHQHKRKLRVIDKSTPAPAASSGTAPALPPK